MLDERGGLAVSPLYPDENVGVKDH
jgi:hypothetical protein